MLRRARSTYAVGVVRPFIRGRDSHRKLVRRDAGGAEWCRDALDVLVYAGQQVCLGDTVVRRYGPAALAPRRADRSPSPPATGSAAAVASSKAVLDVYRSYSSQVTSTVL